MSKMKWFISLVLSLGLLAGCEETAVKPEKKAEPKQEEQKEVAKQEEQKDVPKPEEKQAEPEQKQKQQEEQKDKQEQKVEEKPKEEKPQAQPEVKKEEKQKEQPAANKQPEQQKVQEEKPQQPKAPEVKEEAKVVNQPKETPKQEQKKNPEENNSVPTPPPPVQPLNPVPPPVPPPVVPKAKQVTISIKGNEGYLLGAKKVDVQEGDTVYSVLTGTGLDVDASGSKGDVYVKGIENLYEKDVNDNSGWKYRVNGSFPNRSAGVITVKPGDTIEWVYVY
ncbi:DUF4430 domain-containing protein [Bacillus mycoides]|uniref:DUF4430 domain-containing protein n=1 Tax=Bacillus mycoides TaxID=1405 RepID=UPI00187A3372|nr:DUF4430 domain-containing protein [Bacillus mycoides]MBE7149320.1 DUF4430 domain-containing protein [Bacillus mycoides]